MDVPWVFPMKTPWGSFTKNEKPNHMDDCNRNLDLGGFFLPFFVDRFMLAVPR